MMRAAVALWTVQRARAQLKQDALACFAQGDTARAYEHTQVRDELARLAGAALCAERRDGGCAS
jgi:hypothetical protein